MKKVVFIILFSLLCIESRSQSNNENYECFMEVWMEWKGKDYLPYIAFDDMLLTNIYSEDGEKLKFKSRSGVINYFTKKGWTFVQFFSTTQGGVRNDYLILKKDVKNIDEAKKGLILKEDLKYK